MLLVLERPALAELVKLALNHAAYWTRAVDTAAVVEATIDDWQPNLLILDMDLEGTRVIALVDRRTLVDACPSSA